MGGMAPYNPNHNTAFPPWPTRAYSRLDRSPKRTDSASPRPTPPRMRADGTGPLSEAVRLTTPAKSVIGGLCLDRAGSLRTLSDPHVRRVLLEFGTVATLVTVLTGTAVTWWLAPVDLILNADTDTSHPVVFAPSGLIDSSDKHRVAPFRSQFVAESAQGSILPASYPIGINSVSHRAATPRSSGARLALFRAVPASLDDVPASSEAPKPRQPRPARLEVATVAPLPPLRAAPAPPQDTRPTPRVPPVPPHALLEDPRRVFVADAAGARLVARVAASDGHRVLVTLPDGSMAWSNAEVPTTEPFRPWSIHEVRDALLNGPYRGFRAARSAHYLVVTQGSDDYARACADQLEGLFIRLHAALLDGGLSVHVPEFPLVAVIFRDDRSFREARAVGHDVRGYYEAYSNRIFLAESWAHEGLTPDLAELRRPQTVAHEGVHQLLQNLGIQPRLAAWPTWLVEGLAEYYAPATRQRPPNARERFGVVNPFHMATLIDLDNPQRLWAHVTGASAPGVEPFRPRWRGRDRRSPWIEYVVTQDDFAPTDYALAWLLTHYLAIREPDKLAEYLRRLSDLPPATPRPPAIELAEFRATFGSDLGALARRVDTHRLKLEYDVLPYYAALLTHDPGQGVVWRQAMVSQSPAMIEQWIQSLGINPHAAEAWQVFCIPRASRVRAQNEANSWLAGMSDPR